MRRITIILLFSFNLMILYGQLTRKMSVYIKSIKCKDYPSVYTGTSKCTIKPFRNKTQLVTLTHTLPKPLNDLWVHSMLFYKFGGTTQYRPWLFNNDEDVCGFFKGKTKLSLWYTIVKASVDRFSPNTIHKCPYVGTEGFHAVNAENILSYSVPQVVPTGDYRVYLRFHTSDNTTILDVTLGLHADALQPLEAISMG